jgi:WD40 repeat protein
MIRFWSFEENEEYGRVDSNITNRNPDSFSNKNCPYKILNFSSSSLHKGSIIALFELEDGRIVSSGSDNTIYIFRINENRDIIKIKERVSYESCILELEQNRIITGSLDNRVKVWNINEKKLIQTFLGHTNEITCLIKKDHNSVISGSGDRSIIIWDINNDKNIKRLIGHLDKIINIYYFKEKNRLLSISRDKSLRIWDLNELFCTNVLSNYHSSIMYDLTMCGKDIITVGNDKKIQVFDADEEDIKENENEEENYNDFDN